MKSIFVGIISILISYKLSKVLMILFKGFTDFFISSDDKIMRISGKLVGIIFFSFPTIFQLILAACNFVFFYAIISQVIDSFNEEK